MVISAKGLSAEVTESEGGAGSPALGVVASANTWKGVAGVGPRSSGLRMTRQVPASSNATVNR